MKHFQLVPIIKVLDEQTMQISRSFFNAGADELLFWDTRESIDFFIKLNQQMDVPFIVGGNIKKVEDVKKYLYAGAKRVFFDINNTNSMSVLKEASKRFGKERIALYIESGFSKKSLEELDVSLFELVIAYNCYSEVHKTLPNINILRYDTKISNDEIVEYSKENTSYGVVLQLPYDSPEKLRLLRTELIRRGVNLFYFSSDTPFEALKTIAYEQEQIIPVIVQDYTNKEILMMAYMNKEAYNQTIETGLMTYYSRSRNEIWIKGLTSGHFQYLKELRCDCDNDTLVALVFQSGVACHTGNRSCFFDIITKKDYKSNNHSEILEKVMNVITDRKNNPKEGSYTNYLFDQGIDKILKKLGEEASEIIIASKNPDSEEIKYEISDFLYHMMVLMAEKEITWQDITDELSKRG